MNKYICTKCKEIFDEIPTQHGCFVVKWQRPAKDIQCKGCIRSLCDHCGGLGYDDYLLSGDPNGNPCKKCNGKGFV